jgi:large subunit ribosomal protein L24
MIKLHIKKGDTVQVITGKDKGKSGKVLRAFPKTERVLVEGINLFKKHVRPRREGEKGQTVTIPRTIHVSNVRKTEDVKK